MQPVARVSRTPSSVSTARTNFVPCSAPERSTVTLAVVVHSLPTRVPEQESHGRSPEMPVVLTTSVAASRPGLKERLTRIV